MRTVSSMEAKNRFGRLLDAAQRAPVTVTKKGPPAAVVMSIEDYERMRVRAWERLRDDGDGTQGSGRTRSERRAARR
jgi:prevent-host-death family protein